MTEVRYRADGGSDEIGAADAFKVTKHGAAWHLGALRQWSAAMLDTYAETLPPDDRPVRHSPHVWTFDRRTDARKFAEAAARAAR